MVNGRSGGGGCRTSQASLAVRAAATDHARRVLPIVIELRGAGIISLGKIASELRRRGVCTARGGQWHRMTVSRLLARRKLAGYPTTLREMRAVHENGAANYARSVESLAKRLVARGFDKTKKLSLELNRLNKLTITGKKWSTNSLGMYLKNHCLEIYNEITRRCNPRSKQIEAAIDRLGQQGIVTYPAIAQQLNKNGVPTLSGRARWNQGLVHIFLQRSGRTKTAASVKAKVEQIETAIDRLAQQGIVTYRAIAEGLNKDGVPTLSGRARWNEGLVSFFLQKLGRTEAAASVEAKVEQIKPALNGIVRQGGKVSAQAIAEKLNEKGVPTIWGKGIWTKRMVGTLYRRLGRPLKKPPFWNKTRVARVVELYQAGETLAAIAEEFVEYEVSPTAVRHVLNRAKP